LVTPDKGCQRAFLLNQFLSALSIFDDRLDLTTMADDAFILEQSVKITLGETGYSAEIEIMERGAEVFSLGKYGAPAQARLKAFQTQFLEQAMVIINRETPFRVVIREKLRCGARPTAT
jgi:hypothetical protein